MSKTRCIYELEETNKITGYVIRGGIRATYETMQKYKAINEQNNPDCYYEIVIANDDAITLKEYYVRIRRLKKFNLDEYLSTHDYI